MLTKPSLHTVRYGATARASESSIPGMWAELTEPIEGRLLRRATPPPRVVGDELSEQPLQGRRVGAIQVDARVQIYHRHAEPPRFPDRRR